MNEASILKHYAAVFEKKFSGPIEIRPDAAWFCKDIRRKKDLQWAGYVGKYSDINRALVFGLNLEFTPAWRRLYPLLIAQSGYLQSIFASLDDAEWHWWGRPGYLVRNPEIEWLQQAIPPSMVDVLSWLNELEQILDRKKTWSNGRPMRPQMQIMFVVGEPVVPLNELEIVRNMENVYNRLSPLASLLQ
jgi:hypothetical protein